MALWGQRRGECTHGQDAHANDEARVIESCWRLKLRSFGSTAGTRTLGTGRLPSRTICREE